MSRFVHLHVHSHYSLLEALPKPKELIKAVKEKGMDAVALTDNGVLYGVIEAYQKAADAGVKLIIGMDAYLAPHGRLQKRPHLDDRPFRLVLLAETMDGYRNLVRLSSRGFLEGHFGKPRIDFDMLQEVCSSGAHGLIALSGGRNGEIEQALLAGRGEEARAAARRYAELFGPEHFYLELVDRPELPEQQTINAGLLAISRELSILPVVTKDVFYLKPPETEAWKVLQCIRGGWTLEQFEREHPEEFDASLVDPTAIEERFMDVPEAVENTRRIADRCQVAFDLGKWNFARVDVPEGMTPLAFLRQRAFSELLPKVGGALTPEMTERLEYELSVIDMKGFPPYFLIVSDYIEWARAHGIVTTTRGSAAGSLVGFAIGISNVNPLTYHLPFERFLNPDRPSAPDIDADFADNRRDEMLAYITQKYGADKSAQICTFGTMMARGSVRDVGRALGISYGFVDQIAKLVPMGSQGFPMTLKRALEEAPDLRKHYDTNPQIRRLIDLAQRIEGCARHVSIHAAGVVISPTPLTDFTPLQVESREGKVITQYEMKSVEAAGLLKMDFLGIRNLSILGDTVKLVKKTKGVDLDLDRLPVDDKKTFGLLARGQTMGTFQLNGEGMTKYLMDLKPERIEDVMAMVALYRPGPIESIPEYIKRKHDPTQISYPDARLEEILGRSYGVLVYQDDVLMIAIKLAGYSWLEADKLRKAMGKKIPEEMAQQKTKLLDGLVRHGMTQTKAQHMWELIEPFAAYGFGKAHAASYGLVAYQTAYMKANFPAEYMACLMTAESHDLETIALAVAECRRMGISVLPPDVNESLAPFTYMDDHTIRFGLLVIKNVGAEAVEAIVAERKRGGPYVDLTDLVTRVDHRTFNKKLLEALVKSGALDRFGERKQLMESMDQILLCHKQAQQEKTQQQSSLFSLSPQTTGTRLRLRDVPPASERERLAWENEVLGLYVSAHPFERAQKRFGSFLTPCTKLSECADKAFVRVGGLITAVKVIMTKKGEAMAFVSVADMEGSTEVIVFPRTFKESQTGLKVGAVCLVSAKASKEEDGVKLLANSFVFFDTDQLEEVAQMLERNQWIPGMVSRMGPQFPNSPTGFGAGAPHRGAPRLETPILPNQSTDAHPAIELTLPAKPEPDLVQALRDVFTSAPGPATVFILVESAGRQRRVETEYRVDPRGEVMSALASLVGSSRVKKV